MVKLCRAILLAQSQMKSWTTLPPPLSPKAHRYHSNQIGCLVRTTKVIARSSLNCSLFDGATQQTSTHEMFQSDGCHPAAIGTFSGAGMLTFPYFELTVGGPTGVRYDDLRRVDVECWPSDDYCSVSITSIQAWRTQEACTCPNLTAFGPNIPSRYYHGPPKEISFHDG